MLEKERGDIVLICKKTRISRPTITNAFNTGNASRKTVNAIVSFYTEQKKQVSEIENDNN